MKKSVFLLNLFLATLLGCDLEVVDPIEDTVVPSFTMDNNGCTAPCTITFSNTSTNADTYLWDFGDANQSTEADPSHEYTISGNYEVKLTATGTGGTEEIINAVTIAEPEPLVAFVHTHTEATKSQLNDSFLDNALTNGNSDLILIVTQVFGAYNTTPVGVTFGKLSSVNSFNKWDILNEDVTPIPLNTKFNVLVFQPDNPNAFTHMVQSGNFSGSATTITHPAADGKPDARIFVTHNRNLGGKRVASPVRTQYNNGKWEIVLTDGSALEEGVGFNVYVSRSSDSFTHDASAASIVVNNHITTIDNPLSNTKGNAKLFVTQTGATSINNNPIGIWLFEGNWHIFNQNFVAMPAGASYSVLVVE